MKLEKLQTNGAPYDGNYQQVVSKNGNVDSPPLSPMIIGDGQEDPLTRQFRPLAQRIQKRIDSGEPFFSLEFFPPKTPNGVANFLHRLDRLREGGPLFVDLTWHMGSDPGNIEKETSSISIAAACLNYCRVDTMLHVTCAQYTKQQTLDHLKLAKRLGMKNILALRGDLPQEDNNPVNYKYKALDMIQWTKEEFGDYFSVCCSGYPTGHPEAESYDADLRYLKAKVDAGAQFVITQLFFEVEKFEQFVRDCREIGITVPIIPGIMPIQSYENIRRIAQLSKLEIPQFILDAMEPIKQNDEAVRAYGVQMAVDMCTQILKGGSSQALHIYTLNREAAARDILQQVGLWQKSSIRSLPWKAHDAHHKRVKEDVRPIFWSSRPKSYTYRTKDWDDFPNGRWGYSSSPAYGDLKDYYLFYLKGKKPKEELLKMWGEKLDTEKDVFSVFANFVKGVDNEQGVKVSSLPWNEDDLQPETMVISNELHLCNSAGILTINSQPNVNGAPSDDPLVGWGKPGGYCYQKAYLEFFCKPEMVESLLKILPEFQGVNYHMINHDASKEYTNGDSTTPIAVTWGVFPGREIAQPTVVDPLSFRVWATEAFDAWTSIWASIYEENSQSHKVLRNIHDSYFLVTLVDNDFPHPNCLWKLIDKAINQTQ